MSNLARELEQKKQQPNKSIKESKKAVVKKSWFTPGEKLLGIVFAGLVCYGAVHMISNQAKIYDINKSIQDVQSSIKTQQKMNSDLNDQISELSTYQRIKEKAQAMGLTFNENNIKVVQGK